MSHRTNIGSNHSASHTPKLLQDVLKNIPPGQLQAGDSQHILRVLTECWDQLRGATETSMRAFKLGRAERLTWESAYTVLHNGATWWDRPWFDTSRTAGLDGGCRNGNCRLLTGRTSSACASS